MSYPNPLEDSLNFQSGPTFPDAGIYQTPLQSKGSQTRVLPQVSSRILNQPTVQTAYSSFGLEGLKSILLQELVRLDWAQLQDEMVYLAEGANAHKEIKRALRATKMLASQWIEDPRQNEDIKAKCEYIFGAISSFGDIIIAPPETTASQMQGVQVAFPSMGAPEPVGAEVETVVERASSILLMTDIQGHLDRLNEMLLNTQLVQDRQGVLHWTAPPNFYLVIIGDLFNKSPYSSWGDGVGMETYEVIKSLQRFMRMSPRNILLAYGAYDLDLATGAAFDHPVSGFLGDTLGVNAQAQAIPALLSYLRGTAQPNSSDFAWVYIPESHAYVLKEEYQEQGFPYLSVPALDEAGVKQPDISALITFYEQLYQRLLAPRVEERPQTLQDLDTLATGLLPPATEQLNLQSLNSSLGRCLHYKGLLQGSGTLRFLREQIAGMHILQLEGLEMFAMHPEIQEITLDMLLALKPRGEDQWLAPDLQPFLQQSRTLVQRRLDPHRVLTLLQQLRISRLNDWLALSEAHFYQRLVSLNQLQYWTPEIIGRRDEKGFIEAYRQLRWELINEDPTGLAGYAINMDGISRRGEPLMRKMADVDERTRRSYTKTFLMDLFREELPASVNVQPEGIVVEYPSTGTPGLMISLLIDPSVAIYRDPKENLHMPVKHAAWIEFSGW